MFNCYTWTLKWEMYLPVWLIAILLFYTQLLLFIHLLSWVKTLILFASGVQMYLSFTMELKTKPPNHNFSTCYLRKNLVFLNNYVMFTIPFVCSSFCSVFFFFRVTSMEVARLSLSLKHTLSLFLVSFYFLLINNYSK